MKTAGIIIGACLLLYIVYRIYYIRHMTKDIDKVLARGAVILDVRTEREYSTGHIDGSVNIPLSRLHADTIPLRKDTVYVTVCSHGLRSVKAVTLLKERGYKYVYNGGAWADLPIRK